MSSLPSFFLPREAFHDRAITIHEAEIIRQMRKVFRMKPGDSFVALDGKGHEYICRVDALQHDVVRASIVSDSTTKRETSISVVLYPSLIRRERFVLVLEKCTELGVSGFFPIAASRSPYHAITQHTKERWEHIIREAAEVAHRGMLPKLAAAMTLSDALANIPANDLTIVLSTAQDGVRTANDITTIIQGVKSVHLFLGPEGDYTEEEYGLLHERGAVFFSLGPRIVRSETAAIAAVALFTAFL